MSRVRRSRRSGRARVVGVVVDAAQPARHEQRQQNAVVGILGDPPRDQASASSGRRLFHRPLGLRRRRRRAAREAPATRRSAACPAACGPPRRSRSPAPATASRNTAVSSTVRVTAPATLRPCQCSASGTSETRSRCGLSPNRPQQAAGMRIEPPPSEAVRQAGQARGHRGARAAARAARGALRVPRVAGHPPRARHGEGPDGQLGQAGLADDHGAGLAQSPHQLAVGGRRARRRPRCRARWSRPRRRGCPYRHRHTEERPVLARRRAAVGLVGLGQRPLADHRRKAFSSGSSRSMRSRLQLDQLARGQLAATRTSSAWRAAPANARSGVSRPAPRSPPPSPPGPRRGPRSPCPRWW